ncbi:MAG TPA: glycosyltransferase family 2 protein [Candidatus Caccoplasma merdavium]|nr:glycosyltransferase family 2 protein [Candidatus Caccoplasma merdavium]
MKKIAVLLTVHNRKEKTLRCLHDLFAQEPVDGYAIDVWLTDDGCTDGTAEAIAKHYPEVHIVQGDGNLYWNRGMYTAWQAAATYCDYDFYLWLNDDTFTYPFMLQELCRAAENTNNHAIIVGATQSLAHDRTTYGGRRNKKIPALDGTLQKVDFFNGNIVLIPRYVYNKIGNLDYYFSHGIGDFDYGLRAVKSGIEIFQAGRYVGECDLHESINKWCNPEIPYRERRKMLHNPVGLIPKEIFYFEKRHYGLIKAIFHYCTIYVRCMFPNIWVRLNKYEKK